MKIGILGCGYQCHDKLDERLNSWFNLANKYGFIFSFASTQFKEYSDLGYKYDNQDTTTKLLDYYDNKLIQDIYISKTPHTEAEARNEALRPLLEDGCDIIWLLDLSDEFYTEEQINNIIKYIQSGDNPLYAWFSVPMKNYIFDGKSWISGFCPPRIFKTTTINFTSETKLDRFYWDNDVEYKTLNGSSKSYKEFGNKPIPASILNGGIKHMTWLHSNGKEKVSYQLKHFGHCSYKWNEEKQELEFDLEFYKKNGLSLPIINKDDE